MKEVVIRVNPVNSLPIVFDRDSVSDGQIDSFISGQVKRVGISDYYAHCEPMSAEMAKEVAKHYAEHFNIPADEVIIRERLRKNTHKPMKQMRRKTDDANLVLVHGGNKATAKAQPKEQDYRSADELAQAAQGLQDHHEAEKKGKASAKNPEGATVKKEDAASRTKRKYTRSSPAVRNAKSKAAYERYMKEISEAAAKSPTMEASVQAAEQAPVEDADKAEQEKLAKALRLAKLMIETGLV